MASQQKKELRSGNGSSPVVKSGKTTTVRITSATVQRLESAGSSESAKIARDYVKPS